MKNAILVAIAINLVLAIILGPMFLFYGMLPGVVVTVALVGLYKVGTTIT